MSETIIERNSSKKVEQQDCLLCLIELSINRTYEAMRVDTDIFRGFDVAQDRNKPLGHSTMV